MNPDAIVKIHDAETSNSKLLIDCTSGAAKTNFWVCLVMIVTCFVVSREDLLWTVLPFWTGSSVLWLLYQYQHYLLARYVYLVCSTVGVFSVMICFGQASHAYFLIIPLLFGAVSFFEYTSERIGWFGLILFATINMGLISPYFAEYHVHLSADELDVFKLLFFLLSAISTYYLLTDYFKVNRSLRLQSRSMLHEVQERSIALIQKQGNFELKAKELRRKNRELQSKVEEGRVVERQLKSSNEQLEQFAYAASHDLKEPLRSISSFLQLIQRKIGADADETLEEYFEIVVCSAKGMSKLLDDLLIYSRVGKASFSKEKIELDKVLKTVKVDLRKEIECHNAEISIEGQLPIVVASKNEIKQVVFHLVRNAVLFHDPVIAPKVIIKPLLTQDGAGLIIEDNGIGIADEYRDRIFGLFQRLNTQDKYPGSGVGLALVKKIVDGAGGTVGVENNASVEGGAKFWFVFPSASDSSLN